MSQITDLRVRFVMADYGKMNKVKYGYAGAMWSMAQGYATTDVNTLWCKHRAEVCKLKDEKNQ